MKMSRQQLEAVIGRAIVDETFRVALFADPDVTLAEYDLADDELMALKSMDAENLEGCARRIVRQVTWGHQRERLLDDGDSR
jgi:hypothetical protein